MTVRVAINGFGRIGRNVLREPRGERQVTLLATGSEVALAVAAAELLAARSIAAAVVSMPCWELFAEQPRNYQQKVLGTVPRIGVEAAVRLGWDQWIGRNGVFVGMSGFGVSGPAEELYRHFGITPEAIVAAAETALSQAR